MHIAAVVLLILSGLCFCAAGVLRWRHLTAPDRHVEGGRITWLGMGLLSASVVCSLIDGQHVRFLSAGLSAWAAAAAAIFLTGFLRRPGPTLFALPAGGLALLGAGLALLEQPQQGDEPLAVLAILHVLFMAGYTAAMLVAGSGAGLYLMAARQLKRADKRGLALPSLPFCCRVFEIALVVAAALLIGGVAIGGVAISGAQMRMQPDFTLATPIPVLAVINLLGISALLAVQLYGHLPRRRQAHGILALEVVVALTLIVLFMDAAHG
jgi:hypothetical protein